MGGGHDIGSGGSRYRPGQDQLRRCRYFGDGPVAPGVFADATSGRRFPACGRQVLVPALRPDDIVIMDSLRLQKVSGIRQAIEAAGAQRHDLPPDSPNLGPIEQLFAKIKATLRARAERTVAAHWDALGDLAGSLTPTEWANHRRN